jgi:hypothetical protein
MIVDACNFDMDSSSFHSVTIKQVKYLQTPSQILLDFKAFCLVSWRALSLTHTTHQRLEKKFVWLFTLVYLVDYRSVHISFFRQANL